MSERHGVTVGSIVNSQLQVSMFDSELGLLLCVEFWTSWSVASLHSFGRNLGERK